VDGRTSLEHIHAYSWSLLREEVQNLFGKILSYDEMNHIYPHHVGHWLGLDLHDTPNVSRSIPLEAGHVLTIGRLDESINK
jgi:intermediate cleaving peptidase 55